jgi:hypothetical protein
MKSAVASASSKLTNSTPNAFASTFRPQFSFNESPVSSMALYALLPRFSVSVGASTRVVLSDVLGGKDVVEGRDGRTVGFVY